MDCLGRGTCTVHLISDPDQWGRRWMYYIRYEHQIGSDQSVTSEKVSDYCTIHILWASPHARNYLPWRTQKVSFEEIQLLVILFIFIVQHFNLVRKYSYVHIYITINYHSHFSESTIPTLHQHMGWVNVFKDGHFCWCSVLYLCWRGGSKNAKNMSNLKK